MVDAAQQQQTFKQYVKENRHILQQQDHIYISRLYYNWGIIDVREVNASEVYEVYDLIEKHVAPRFYDHDAEGVPQRWIEMVRHTLRSLGLKRIGDVVVKEDRPEIRGMVHTVRHLVVVEEVKEGA